MNSPTILLSKPTPLHSQKPFHGKKLLIWEGLVDVKSVNGWVSNPRLDLEIKRFKDEHVGRSPNNEELFTIMKSIKDFRLKELADDIRINGVRQPIVLSATGRLLDGNRRYYAVRLILESLNAEDASRSDFQSIPAWVLDERCTEEDEDRILVQENFYPALKVEWPDFVKAQRIYADLQKGDPVKTVSQRYNWNPAKLRETKNIMMLIDEFINYATTVSNGDEDGLGLSELEAERIAAEYYQYFNEAQKSFRQLLEKDIEFKFNFFQWIYKKKFSSFAEVRIAADAWENEEAKRILLSDDIRAGKKAKAIIDYAKNVEKTVRNTDEIISDFVTFLGSLTTEQKKELPKDLLIKLKTAISTVVKMIESAKNE